MAPYTRLNLIKRSQNTRYIKYFDEEVQDCKDGSGLRVDFWTGCLELKVAILEKF